MEKRVFNNRPYEGLRIKKKDDNIEIDLFELIRYFRSKLILIILTFIIGAVVSGMYTYFLIEPQYTATSKIYVVSASTDTMVNLSDLNLGTGLSADYLQVMTIRPIFNQVIDDLELDYTYSQLRRMTKIEVMKNTRIMTISVTSPDPEEAQLIANDIAKVAEVQIPKLMDTPKPHIIEPAILPVHKSSPSLTRNIIVVALGLSALLFMILTVIFILQDTVNSADDIEKMFGTLPLAIIPEGNVRTLGNWAKNKKEKK